MSEVHDYVVRLAQGHPHPSPKPKVEIGSLYTGKREFHWDSRTGTYSELLPLIGYDEWLIQQALVGPMVLRKRKQKNIRQSPP